MPRRVVDLVLVVVLAWSLIGLTIVLLFGDVDDHRVALAVLAVVPIVAIAALAANSDRDR